MSNVKIGIKRHETLPDTVSVVDVSKRRKSGVFSSVLEIYYSSETPIVILTSTSLGGNVRVAADGLSGVQKRHAKMILGKSFSSTKSISKEEMEAVVVERVSRIIGESLDEMLIG